MARNFKELQAKMSPERQARNKAEAARRITEAWAAGFAAGEAGQALTDCPYPARSTESLAWHSGFIEGKAKRQSEF
jgi:ribosome modulation factor